MICKFSYVSANGDVWYEQDGNYVNSLVYLGERTTLYEIIIANRNKCLEQLALQEMEKENER